MEKVEEVWKQVINYDHYEVSNYGRLRNKKRNHIRVCYEQRGYVIFKLNKNGKTKQFYAHNLIAIHFIDNPNNYAEVNHLGEKNDNRIWMLEWTSHRDNMIHAAKYLIKFATKPIHKICPETGQVVQIFERTSDVKRIMTPVTLRKYIDTGKIYKGYLWCSANKKQEIEMDGEIWRKLSDSVYDEVNTYTNYQVSNFGRIKSYNKILIPYLFEGYYSRIKLCNNGSRKTMLIHRLVLMGFNVPNPENKPQVDHIDTIRDNNRLDNLRWSTQQEQAENIITAEKLKKENITQRLKISVIYPNGDSEIFLDGVNRFCEKTGINKRAFKKYSESGEIYNGYQFKIFNEY